MEISLKKDTQAMEKSYNLSLAEAHEKAKNGQEVKMYGSSRSISFDEILDCLIWQETGEALSSHMLDYKFKVMF